MAKTHQMKHEPQGEFRKKVETSSKPNRKGHGKRGKK